MSVAGYAQSGLAAAVKFLNQPLVKEGVKNVAGSVTFAFGIVEAHDLYQILRGREISTDIHDSQWKRVANKVIILSAKVSLILSAGVSRPGVFIISTLIGSVFTTSQLERAFGPNTIFAINPWHPRHVASIVAFVLAVPSVLQGTCRFIRWTYNEGMSNEWLTDRKVRLMALFNTITSRPMLHWGNQFGRFL